jgi:NitT/TauT family transport system substrate-binding protein
MLLGLACAARLAAAVPLTVQLDWITNAQFAGVLVAKERGWYAAAGLDVTVKPLDPAAMSDSLGPVVGEPNVIGVADGLVLLRARAGHRPIKAFGTMLQASPLCIMALKSGPIRAFADLRGRTIGLHSYDHTQLRLMLAHNHLAEADVRTLDIEEDLTSLIAGKIDAQVAYSIDEKVGVELKGYPTRTFPGYDNGFITYSQVYYATETFVRTDPAVLATFLQVTNRGWREAFARPHATALMIITQFLKHGDPAYQEGSLVELEHFATLESDHLGSMMLETWERSCRAFGLPPELAGQLADFSILQRLEQLPP